MKQFVSIAEAADALGASKPYIRSLVNGIRANTPDRYNVSDVFGRSKISVRFVALQDYAAYGEDIGHAPPYRPIEREQELGIGHTQVVMVDAQKVADIICAKMAAAIGGMK